MADIELVIKISENSYKSSCIGSMLPSEVESVINAIKNGTPLPKGHGRIADMDAAIKCLEDVEGEDATWAISLIEWACSKRTIIGADKSESEG